MRGHILLTRPEAESKAMAPLVAQCGFTPVVDPVIAIAPLDARWPGPSGFKAVALTSANAVPPMPPAWLRSGLPLYAVGEKTAAAAQAAGFAGPVSVGPGTAAGLADMLRAAGFRRGARVLHPCGRDVAAPLAVRGLSVEPIVVYEARGARSLSKDTLDLLDARRIAGVMLYSARSGGIFADLIAGHRRTSAMNAIKALCLSAPVVESVCILPWKDIMMAARPHNAAMMDLLNNA